MKTRRFCPMCGRPVCKSMQKKNPFRCYNCEKDFNSREVLCIKDLPKVKKRQWIAYRNECQHGDYPHGFKRPYPKNKNFIGNNNIHQDKYNIANLIPLNGSYHLKHGVRQYDVDKANQYVSLIEGSRSSKHPRNGDIIRLTTRHGDYYHEAHLEGLDDCGFEVCEQPYVPFIYPSGDKNGIRCNTSGGGWLHIPPKALKYVGKEEKEFCDWGWNGACGGGAVHFKAEVSVWEYIQPNALYGKFSTKEWRRIRLDKHSEENWKKDGYLYSGSGLAFRNQEELDEFMKLYKGTMFQGVWDNSFVVWCYYEIQVGVSQEEWNRLPYPETKKLTKIHPDDKRHILYSYFFNKNIH